MNWNGMEASPSQAIDQLFRRQIVQILIRRVVCAATMDAVAADKDPYAQVYLAMNSLCSTEGFERFHMKKTAEGFDVHVEVRGDIEPLTYHIELDYGMPVPWIENGL